MSTEAALAPDWPIETERLLLRPIDPVGDLDALHASLSRADVCASIPAVPATLEQVAQQYADPDRRRTTLTEPKQAIRVAVVLRASGRLIGDVMLFWRSREHRTGEVGYVLHPDHHGRGSATEAVQVLLRLGFEGLGLHRIVGRIDQRNPASAAVLRKVGMRQEAVLVDNEWFKGGWSTEIDFAILESEWRALPS